MASKIPSSQSSSSLPKWPARNHVALFVRCLHLLDLDLLEDWPNVTEELFAPKLVQQTLQQRVRAVEWSLYRLFEKFDPDEAKDKLRPFFPPATQLQSLNLRAALYRCLTELKKNGVLGKDVVLRKTMLDDCKGERVEEVLSNFAICTLRKTTELPAALEERRLTEVQLLPLVLAYRSSIQHDLLNRKEIATRAYEEQRELETASTILQERHEDTRRASVKTDLTRQREVQALINSNWIGSDAYADILLHGTPRKVVLKGESEPSTPAPSRKSMQLLSELDARINEHEARLAEWKIVAKDLMFSRKKHKAMAQTQLQPSTTTVASTPHFSQHLSLNLTGRRPNTDPALPLMEPYGRLLSAMELELTQVSAPIDKTASSEAKGSSSSTIPKVSDTEPVIARSPRDSSGLSHDDDAAVEHDTSLPLSTNDSHSVIESDDLEQSVSPSPLRSSDEDSPWIPIQQSNATTVDDDRFTPVEDSSPLRLRMVEPPIPPSKLWMSLADRTRTSMQLTGRQNILPDPESPVDGNEEGLSGQTEPILQSDEDKSATLLERTRQSMSLLSNASSSRPRNDKTEKRISQTFPVNQFKTPGRLQRLSEAAPSSRSSTPRDQLFEEDADYASIFKSRPKIALSPAFSPQRRSSGLGSIVEQEITQLNLDSDEEMS